MYQKISLAEILNKLYDFFPKSDLSILTTTPASVIASKPPLKLPLDIHDLRNLREKAYSQEKDIILTINVVARFAKENGFVVDWKKIPEWEFYESGYHVSDEDLFNTVFKEHTFKKNSVIFITQEALNTDDCGFVVPAESLLKFVSEDYDQLYNYQYSTFEGLQDLMFMGVDQNMITLFSKNGYFTHLLKE